AGKIPKGTIGLKAFREKSYVTIVIDDDGKGMDPGKFRQLAFDNGIMTEDQAAKLSDAEALNIAFHPGVTTSQKVTDISGRGVGLDVVKTRIEGLGGSVKLESTLGIGTRITLQLPITVAIIQSQMVKVGGNVYAIPITNVVRDVTIHREQIKTVKSEEVVMIRNEVLPIVRLNKLFGVEGNGSEKMVVVVVEKHGSNIGLVVDQLIGQQEVIIKNLNNRLLKGLKGFAGATILGDGNVALIIDVGTLL
ncbi:MAG TPA: chemotaxis protein CheA, partial [Candidatus Methanoperedenaceae archaeon]|nr:chemotaxis protein CheA [Candidatus Methanoperedenaceae archaeon]